MGGGNSKESTKIKIETEVKNQLTTKVTNFTKNVNKNISDNTLNVSNKMVQQFVTKNKATSVAENILKDVTIIATKGSNIDITQKSDAMLKMAAIVNIVNNNEQKNELANKVANAIQTKIQNDSQLKNDMIQAAKVEKASQKAGGFADMVGAIAGAAQSMVGGLTGGGNTEKNIEKEIKNKISNEINTTLENTTINENEMISKLSTNIQNSFKTMTEDECLGSAKARNMAEKLKLIADEGATIRVLQVAKADAIVKCISNKQIGNKALSGITNDTAFKSALDAINKSKSETKTAQDLKSKTTEKKTDAIADTAQTAVKTAGDVANTGIKTVGKIAGGLTMILPIIIIGVLIVGAVFLLKGGSIPGMGSMRPGKRRMKPGRGRRMSPGRGRRMSPGRGRRMSPGRGRKMRGGKLLDIISGNLLSIKCEYVILILLIFILNKKLI